MGIFVDTKRPYGDGAARWVARIHDDAAKPRYQESRTLLEAELFVVRAGGDRNRRLRAGMSLSTVVATFLERLPEELDADSVGRYADDLQNTLLATVPGDTVMASLIGDHYRLVLDTARAGGASDGTLYQLCCSLRRFAVDALVAGFTAIEPVSDILAGMERGTRRVLAVVPTKDHLDAMMKVSGPRTRLTLSLMTVEGMETAELDRALRGDADFERGTFFIRHNPVHAGSDGAPPGRTVSMSAGTRIALLRWMATSPGGAGDPLFTGGNPGEFGLWLRRAQMQAGLVKKRRDGTLEPLYLPKHFSYYAAQTRALAGEDLLSITREFGYENTAAMHRRVGWIIEAKAHSRNDRALMRKAGRAA